MAQELPKSKGLWADGLAGGWPIILGYAPIGMAFGVLAAKVGLSVAEIGLMSVIVFAGSSQFIAVSMIGAAAAPLSIVGAVFMVNLRHVLMSSSLARYLSGLSLPRLLLFGYGVTDESFAVNFLRFVKGSWSPSKALVVNHSANLAWILSSMAGGFLGEQIPDGAFGLDYALIAMFIGLLAFQVRGWPHLAAAVVGGAAAVILSLAGAGNGAVILAALLGATAGFIWKRRVASPRKNKPGRAGS